MFEVHNGPAGVLSVRWLFTLCEVRCLLTVWVVSVLASVCVGRGVVRIVCGVAVGILFILPLVVLDVVLRFWSKKR